MKYKVMSKAGANAWHVEHFATEKEARAHANQEYKAGCNIIELYGKTRHTFAEALGPGRCAINAAHTPQKQGQAAGRKENIHDY